MRYIILGQNSCSACQKAMNFLDDKNEPYEYISIDGPSGTSLRQFLKAIDWNTVPAVWYDIDFIGGWEDLKELEEQISKELNL